MEANKIQFKDLTQPLSPIQYWTLALLAPIVFIYFTWAESFDNMHTFWKAYSWYTIVGITQGLGHSYFGILLERFFPWKESPKLRLVITIASIVLYSILAYVVVATFLALFWYDISFAQAVQTGMNGIWIAVKISFSFAFVFATFSFFINWQKTRLEAERLEKELANYRYTTLKNQINPHFLFNSLNVLTDLVHEDADLSEKYIQQLSKIYRYVLESTQHQLILLSKELMFIDSYVFLLKIRFGEKVKIHIDAQANNDNYIVPVSIQMLIENAIKHNQLTTNNPLIIKVYKRNDRIVVYNYFQPRLTPQKSSGTGLDNLIQQYKMLNDHTVNIESTDDYFQVSLPILHKPKP